MKVAIIADIHSNLEAFKAVLESIGKKKIICAGDIVGYGANPNECVELVRENKIESVMGNHDAAVLKLLGVLWFNIYAQKAVLWTRKQLKKRHTHFLKKLPTELKTKDMYLVHGSPLNPLTEYLFEFDDLGYFTDSISQKIIVMAHTHVPFVKKHKGKLIINPGSVGQPRDSNPKASYCELSTNTMRAKIIRVQYDISKSAQKIINAGLPKYLADRLYRGK